MRVSPRTWPSIRFNRFRQDALMSVRIASIYPPRVYDARRAGEPMKPQTAREHTAHTQHAAAPPAIDPVCGMTVDPATAKHRLSWHGRDYVFCCAGCRTKFEADPQKYLARQGAGSAPRAEARKAPAGAIYTCPMHPEVRQIGPGSCPICGMALEPEIVTLDDAPDPELADMTRRFWTSVALTLPIVVLDMGQHLSGRHWIDPQLSNLVQLILATPVVAWAGWPFFVRGWNSVLSRNLNMFTL